MQTLNKVPKNRELWKINIFYFPGRQEMSYVWWNLSWPIGGGGDKKKLVSNYPCLHSLKTTTDEVAGTCGEL